MFASKKITIMGLGLNQGGLGAARFFAKAGANVLVTDLKSNKELTSSLEELKGLPIKYVFGRHREKDFINADLIIQNPAVPNDSKYLHLARKNRVPIETDMGIFLKLCPSKRVIAVAGTKGKSTVSALIHHILRTAKRKTILAGNIGTSVLDVLPKVNPETIVVLEISSWQLQGLERHKFRPWIAVLTNILPDHLDRYRDFNDYVQAEKLIFKFQKKSDFLVTNYSQSHTRQAGRQSKSRTTWFDQLRARAMPSEISLLGEHNLANALAAQAAAIICQVPIKTIKKSISDFKGLKHRLEFVRKLKGVKFYNDSAATIPESCLAGLQSFVQPIILILGGKDKKLSFEKLIKYISQEPRIKKIVLLSHPDYSASRKILKSAKKYKIASQKTSPNQIIPAFNMKEAVKIAWRNSAKGDIVLLCSGATSFGIFKNEFDRGEQFIREVQSL